MRSKPASKASQAYDCTLKVLKLDLHGCSVPDADKIVPTKVYECYETGTNALLIIYGVSKQDLGNAVHRSLQAAAVKNVCGKKWSMALSYDRYSRVENCSPNDSAVLVSINTQHAPRKRYFSGFATTYSGDVAGLDQERSPNFWRLMVEPKLAAELRQPPNQQRGKKSSSIRSKTNPAKKNASNFST